MSRKVTNNDFINRAKKVYPNNEFDYKLTNYINSHNKVIIICNLCHNVFDVEPYHHLGKRGCPFCAGKRIAKSNCLATTHPELAKEWNHIKNNTLTVHDITHGSGTKVWWLCVNGHEWLSSPNTRSNGTSFKKSCPYCINQLVCSDNCLENVAPDIAKELHPTKNGVTADQIISGSNHKFWWKCSKCSFEWRTSLDKRMRKPNPTGCPACANYASKRGAHYSIKNNQTVIFDSSWEEERMIYFDSNPEIKSWGRCKDKIVYFDRNKKRKYCPDFEILYLNGNIIVEEVKGIMEHKIHNYVAKYKAAVDFYSDKNKKYDFVTKEDRFKMGSFIKLSADELLNWRTK